MSFSRRRVDDALYLGYSICREATLLGVLTHHLLVGSDVYTVDFVCGDVALQPLDLWTQVLEDATGGLGNALQLLWCQLPRVWDFTFDKVFWHSRVNTFFTFTTAAETITRQNLTVLSVSPACLHQDSMSIWPMGFKKCVLHTQESRSWCPLW
jgi:hypothetical protein